jgi:hypothetical protein
MHHVRKLQALAPPLLAAPHYLYERARSDPTLTPSISFRRRLDHAAWRNRRTAPRDFVKDILLRVPAKVRTRYEETQDALSSYFVNAIGSARKGTGVVATIAVVVFPYKRNRSKTVSISSIDAAWSLTRKQSSPVIRWHSATVGSWSASSAMRRSCPTPGRILAYAEMGSPRQLR